MIEENDVIFAFSNSGETPELINLLKYSRTKAIIAVSQSKTAYWAICHCTFRMQGGQGNLPLEPGSNNEYNGCSSYGRCHLCEHRIFQNSLKRLCTISSRGTLGRNLLTKAKDLMTTTVPFVQKSDTLHEILLKVSAGRLGLACRKRCPR